ncbi:hypothetical protein BC831DRAFT_444590 [Entophlyctis helioformis]|nr:hypothetical protein BC831DRAFT_444590 [Entophlyctis helioformis]
MSLTDSALYLLAHPDLFITDLVRAFWNLVAWLTLLLHRNAPKPVADWLASAPQQVVALVVGGLLLYFVLFVLAALLRGILRSVTFVIKSVVFSFVLVLALYLGQVYLLQSKAASSSSSSSKGA